MLANKKLDYIQTHPISGTIGAEVTGIDLSNDLTPDEQNFVYRALLDHLVLFFPGQKSLSPGQLQKFSSLFGEIDKAPFSYPFVMPTEENFPEIWNMVKEGKDRSVNLGGFWHTDVTFREKPHKIGIIYAKQCPVNGGDTMFSNQYLAYETLSDGMKKLLKNLDAKHSNLMPHGGEKARFAAVAKNHAAKVEDRLFSSKPATQAKVEIVHNVHPVVRVHPETGQKCLFVNRGFTECFAGMTIEESIPLLEFLWNHASRAEFTCRYRWSTNTVGVWDNRCTQHYALNDYYGERRHMQRIAIHEETRPK